MRASLPATSVAMVTLFALGSCRAEPAPKSNSAVARQLEMGASAFSEKCARCHGAAGQGSARAPLLVGTGALPLHPRAGQKRTQPFHTALDVALFATKAMPPDEEIRATIPEADYWAILAFALSANGVALSAPVDAHNAASIVLHP